MARVKTALLAFLVFVATAGTVAAKNRDPNDYPQKAKVVSFQRQPCLVLYVIHQKGSGNWGQDDYVVTDMSAGGPETNQK